MILLFGNTEEKCDVIICDRGITFFLDDNKTNDSGNGKEIGKK